MACKNNHSQSGVLSQEKGMVLYIVLTTLLIVVILSNVLLSLVANQNRLTHHQTSRIQSYYATQAGLVFAFEQLRQYQNDTVLTSPTWGQCGITRDCLGIPLFDDEFPFTIENKIVMINVIRPGQPGCTTGPVESACVNVSATHTYSP